MPSYNVPPVPQQKIRKDKRANGEGSVYIDRAKKRYIACVYDINAKPRKKVFKKKSDADRWRSDQVRARELGLNTYDQHPKMTVSEYLNSWLQRYQFNKDSTRKNYSDTVRCRINPYIGNLKTSKLSPQAIEGLFNNLISKGYKAGTIRGVHRVLSIAFEEGKRLGEISINPLERVKVPKGKSVPKPHIPAGDFEKIYITAMANPYMHARVEIGGMLGLRPGEIYGLMWSDVDWINKNLLIARQIQRVQGTGLVVQSVKQNAIRSIPLSDEQLRILNVHKIVQDQERLNWDEDFDFVFPNTIGKALDRKRDASWWRTLCKESNVPHYQMYQLRKTAFTNLARTTDLKTLMALSGHSQVKTLMDSYVFSTTDAMKKAVNGIDQLRPQKGKVDTSTYLRLVK
jgi:integrase